MTSPPPAHSHGPLLAELLELDAILNAPMIEQAVAVAAEVAKRPTRVLDIGAGTGTGTIALARRFPGAEIVAVDLDEGLLSRVRDRARAAGVDAQVTTVRADVVSQSDRIGGADLVWASMALHEVTDPAAAIRNIFEAIRPGGHVVIIEMDAPPRLLPQRLSEWEERLHAAARPSREADHPDWTARLQTAGFETLPTRALRTNELMAAAGPAGDYAVLELRRVGHIAISGLDDADRASLLTLAGDGPGNVRGLGELHIRATRTLWAARRP